MVDMNKSIDITESAHHDMFNSTFIQEFNNSVIEGIKSTLNFQMGKE